MSYYSTVTWVFLYPGLLCVCHGLERTGRLFGQTALFQEPPHQQACNSHVCDVCDPAQAHLFFPLPPSTTTPSTPLLLPVPQLRATSSSKRSLCTNTHDAFLSLKITSCLPENGCLQSTSYGGGKGLFPLLSSLFLTAPIIPPSTTSILP